MPMRQRARSPPVPPTPASGGSWVALPTRMLRSVPMCELHRARTGPLAVAPETSCYVHPMARDGVYEEDWLASGYATSRPPVHSQILDQVASLQSVSQIDLALDIGCGAGISTIALMQRGIGDHVLGIDPSQCHDSHSKASCRWGIVRGRLCRGPSGAVRYSRTAYGGGII